MYLPRAYLTAITDSKRAKIKQDSKNEVAGFANTPSCNLRVVYLSKVSQFYLAW